MTLYAGVDLNAADLNLGVRRCWSAGGGLVSVGGSGAEATMTFDTKNSATAIADITVSGVNNTTMTFNADGEYTYGFGVRFVTGALSVTTGDYYCFVRLNGVLEIGGKVEKPVLSTASAITYYACGTWTRDFVTSDQIEVRLRNGTNVTVTEDTNGESTFFFAKRSLGGS